MNAADIHRSGGRPYPEVTVAVLPSSLAKVARKPESTRLEHLCWFAVRAAKSTRTPAFLARAFTKIATPKNHFHLPLRSRSVGRINLNPLRLLPREQCTKLNRFRNINLMSIAYALRLGLGPDLTLTMITMAQETLLLRPRGFSPLLWLLIPAFSLPTAPPTPIDFTADRNAPLPRQINLTSISSV